MKRILLPLIFFLPLLSIAQNEWAPVGAKWWYGSYDIWAPAPYPVGYFTEQALDENLINCNTCREITTHFSMLCRPCYIYSDSNRVYYYHLEIQKFFLLYDMNLNPGESWNIYYCDHFSPYNCEYLMDEEYPEYFMDSIVVTVIDTSSIEVNGISLKAQQISTEPIFHQFGFSDEIIERVGNTFSFFPMRVGMIDAGFSGLRCYQDSVVGLYHYSTSDCEFTDVGITENQISQLEIFPNPAHDFLYLKNTSQKLNYKILDYTGRVILSGKTEKEINVQTLSPGYYSVVFKDEVSRAFIKQ